MSSNIHNVKEVSTASVPVHVEHQRRMQHQAHDKGSTELVLSQGAFLQLVLCTLFFVAKFTITELSACWVILLLLCCRPQHLRMQVPGFAFHNLEQCFPSGSQV